MRKKFTPRVVQQSEESKGDIEDKHVKGAIVRDIRSGKLKGRVTYPMIKKSYGLRVDRRIRKVLISIEAMGLIARNGRSFYTVESMQEQVA